MRTFICTAVAVTAVAMIAISGTALYCGFASVSTEQKDGAFAARLQVTDPFQRALRIDEPKEIEESATTETAMGTVKEYEDGAQSFVLATSDNRELTIYVDSTARIIGRRLAGLQLGDRVTVTYTTVSGEHTASSLTVE